ncbi:hypothetical protein J7J12_00580 [bacterium]|nr:hypothetical protein [bacterium]
MKRNNLYFSKIEKLKNEIEEIFKRIFGLDLKEESWILYESYKEAKENMIRLGVLWLQLAIEDLLESFITGHIYVARKNVRREKMPKYFTKSKRCKEIEKIIHKMKFITKVKIAENFNVITKREAKMLEKLWEIRCKLAHNWMVNKKILVKKGKGSKRRYQPFIEYNGKNLFSGRVFLEEFDKDYSKIFLRLFNQLPLE